MITIDGSKGEGGGQIARSALALSLITGKPVTINHIRAKRQKPGLMPQHLAAVRAAASVGQAEVEGAAQGSSRLSFRPGRAASGNYEFKVGTAGSCMLVLQTVLPALMIADKPSRLILEGGTHNPLAPPFEFLHRVFFPLLRQLGPQVSMTLERPGFYPQGGGKVLVDIQPSSQFNALRLVERGVIRQRQIEVILARLPRHIAEREAQAASELLHWNINRPSGDLISTEETDAAAPAEFRISEWSNSLSPGNVMLIAVASEHVAEVFASFGERGRPAGEVAADAATQCDRYLRAGVPVGEHLADQLLLPLAIAADRNRITSTFRTLNLTGHSHSQIEVLKQFLSTDIHTETRACDDIVVTVGPQ